jgi:hypothetical protein
MQRLLFAVAFVVAACGGASQEKGAHGVVVQGVDDDAKSGPGGGSDVQCHDETMTGSSIPRHVCRSKAQSDRDRDGARDWMDRSRATLPPSK